MAGEAVLVVDDHPLNLKLARVTLAAAGYDVRTAVDAEEARRVLASFPAKLVLMDLQLPGMDGFALTKRLKADPALAGLRVVALTALAMKGDEERARAAGCDGYITKPVDVLRLPGQVAELLATAPGGKP